MTFWNGTEVTILFDWWMVMSTGGYVGSVFVILLLGILHQWLIALRHSHVVQMQRAASELGVDDDMLETNKNVTPMLGVLPLNWWTAPWVPELVDGVLYGVGMVLAYWLMLIIMTYNTGLFISVILGEVVGHVLFSSRRKKLGAAEEPLLDNEDQGCPGHDA